jgi:hypothetical protein
MRPLDGLADFLALGEALWPFRWELLSLVLYGVVAGWAIRLMVRQYPRKPETTGKPSQRKGEARGLASAEAGRALRRTGKVLWVLTAALAWKLPAKRRSKWYAVGLLSLELGTVGVLLGLIAWPLFLLQAVVLSLFAYGRKRDKRAQRKVTLPFERRGDY